MRTTTIVMAALAVACGSAASAQEVVHWSLPERPGPVQHSYFPMGTPLRVVTSSEFSTQSSRPGDRFYLTVAEPLVYRGQVVVPAGALVAGEVARVEQTGPMGKRGEIAIQPLYVQTPNGPVRLTGRAEKSGKGQQVLAIGGAAFVAWPMIFIHGTSARLPAKTSFDAYLAEDLHFPLAATVPVAAYPDARPVTAAAAAPIGAPMLAANR